MSIHADTAPIATTDTQFEPARVNVRIKITALWTAMLFVFVYVDLYRYYRADFRAEVEAGELGPFAISQGTLVGTTVYVLLPILMVFATLVLRPAISRVANIALSVLYAVTIVAGAVGEWYYYVLGSVVEVAMLAGIAYYAWTWPRVAAGTPGQR
jgi:hypothetical protein